MKNGDHLFLVDGSAYIFRAFHALPPLTRKSDGLPVGAVAGFCNMLWKLLQDARDTGVGVTPTHFAVIFDYSSKTFRKELFPDYKANRSDPPEDLVPQFGLIREATRAFNLPCIEIEGYEADDIIATYARQAEAVGAHATIISSDKDLMQLVTGHVSMYDSMKDRQIGIAEVVEKFGVAPGKMIDLQSLTGDSTDNIPGVPGIGPKTAAQLLGEFGDLDTLLERAGEIKQNKRRENLITFADQARLSRELVTLKTDTPVDIDLDGLKLEPQDGPKLIAFLKAMEFNSLTRRVAEATETKPVRLRLRLWRSKREARRTDPISTRDRRIRHRPRRPMPRTTAQWRRLHWPKPDGRRRPRRSSTATPMCASAISTRLTPGSPGRARPASSPSIPRPTRSTPCRPSWPASRCVRHRAKRPMCRSTTRAAMTTCSAADWSRTRSRRTPRSAGSKPCSRTRRSSLSART